MRLVQCVHKCYNDWDISSVALTSETWKISILLSVRTLNENDFETFIASRYFQKIYSSASTEFLLDVLFFFELPDGRDVLISHSPDEMNILLVLPQSPSRPYFNFIDIITIGVKQDAWAEPSDAKLLTSDIYFSIWLLEAVKKHENISFS